MINPSYRVQLLSPEETDRMLAAMKQGRPGPGFKGLSPRMTLSGGLDIKGSFEITARDAKSNEIEWQYAGDNLITDFGRRVWASSRWNGTPNIGFSPSREPPSASRCSVTSDVSQSFMVATSLSVDSSTNTKIFTGTGAGLNAPASNRTLASIGLSTVSSGGLSHANMWSLALLTPPKTQTPSQTLEIVYRFSMIPIV